MRIGDLKPKGSDKTLKEWFDICDQNACHDCELRNECEKIGFWYTTAEAMTRIEVEV